MITFLKGILKGLFYVIFFPLGIIAISLYAFFGIFVFIYRLIKLTILFFTGRNLKNELPEDEEVRQILEKNSGNEEKHDEPVLNLYPSDQEIYKTDEYVSPTFDEKKEEQQQSIKEEEDKNE